MEKPRVVNLPDGGIEVVYQVDGKGASAFFTGEKAQERAEDYAEALGLLFEHTQPGTELVDVIHFAFHHTQEHEEGDETGQER